MQEVLTILGAERRKKIIAFIKRDSKVYVTELSKMFGIAEETVRRDLARLEKDGLLSRTYGGAVSIDPTREDPSFSTRTSMNLQEKQAIAANASALISDNATIMVDASTTALEVVHALTKKKNLTIITTSIKLTAEFIHSNFNIICTGGSLRSHSSSLIGPLAANAVMNYHVDVAVIGCKSLSLESGIMESNEAECELKKRMICQAAKTMLVADHSKFDKTSFVKLIDFTAVDYLITDQAPSAKWLELLNANKVKLFY